MIILRTKIFSKRDIMIKNITSRLDREGLEDYEVSSRIPNDVISINSDLSNIMIYIPSEFEYSQYEIDNFIRSIAPFVRTETTLEDRNIFVMRLSGKLTESQYYRLIKEIIKEEEFCTIINDEED